MAVHPAHFYTLDGSRLAGTLSLPQNASQEHRVPAVLLCQGLSGIKNLVLPKVALKLANAGFASLAFDYRGYGESEGERGWVLPLSRVDDALYACAYLCQCPEVDTTRVGVYGLSFGGPVALCVAAKEPHVRTVVAVSAPGNGETLMRSLRTSSQWIAFKERILADRRERATTGKSALVDIQEIFPFSARFLAKYASLKPSGGTSAMAEPTASTQKPLFYLSSAEAVIDFRPEEAARRLGSRPLLLISGEKDDVATVEQVLDIYQNVSGPKKLVIVPGHDHVDLDTGQGLEYQTDLTVHWFNNHLK